ncbi:uncharacterized protein [Equus asinus]|uniref:uncharacterized protein isoform X4 n=1 Tax=Equus asinus TaxID=9793 RepID=UPI0038F68BF1
MDGTYLPFNLGHTCVVFYLVAQPDHPMDSETIYIFRQNHPICNNMEGPGARQRCPGAGFYWLARVNGRPLFSTPSSVMSCWWLEISHIVQRAHWKLWEELEVIRAGRLRILIKPPDLDFQIFWSSRFSSLHPEEKKRERNPRQKKESFE